MIQLIEIMHVTNISENAGDLHEYIEEHAVGARDLQEEGELGSFVGEIVLLFHYQAQFDEHVAQDDQNQEHDGFGAPNFT